jgi:hypothetical protein
MKVKLSLHLLLVIVSVGMAVAQNSSSAKDIPTAALINPSDVAALLQSKAEKPLILQVGSHVLFQQAHVPGSEYIGAASTAEGRQQLQKRVSSLPKTKSIILYCGCCPWEHCPNVKPAYDTLHGMGYTNLKVMFVQNDFGKDWVEKGFPVAKGD